MPDYDQLLDDEIRAFLARTECFYPPDAVDLTVAEQREVYDRMCAAFDAGRPKGVRVEDKVVGRVPCRIYEPPQTSDTTVFFCHGGGFVVGGLDSHDSICAEFCARTTMRVIAVNYRLSPEHPFPDDFNDALAVFDAAPRGDIVLCGDSAGGNLVAAIAHARRGDTCIKGQLLIYPGLGGDWSWQSYQEHAEAPGLTTKDMQFYMQIRSAGRERAGDPTYAPLHDNDFAGLPPTVIITAACDPLASDGDVYAQQINAAGGQALWRNEDGLVHGYLRARHMSERARASFDRMIASLDALSDGRLPDF